MHPREFRSLSFFPHFINQKNRFGTKNEAEISLRITSYNGVTVSKNIYSLYFSCISMSPHMVTAEIQRPQSNIE